MSLFLSFLSVFFVTTSTTADYKVFVTKNRSEADLWVWQSKSKYESAGNEEIWFKTNSRYESSFTVRYVTSKYQADIVIYYVDSKYQAGWKKNHRLKNNLFIPKK
jgi:hypothetical protein